MTVTIENIPPLLRDVTPRVGSVWHWEPMKPHASVRVVVTDVKWNGEEVWVESASGEGEPKFWNSLDRWVEATVLVSAPE